MEKIKQEYIQSDIETLKKRKQRLLTRIKEIHATLKGIDLQIKNKKVLLR